MNKILIVVLSSILISFCNSSGTNNILCYYGSWATYRPNAGNVSIEHLDPNLCTHLIYTFIGIKPDGDIAILDDWLEIQLGALNRFANLKEKNPNLKVMVAIGGWSQGSHVFSAVTKNPSLRQKFVRNVVNFMQKYNFDGFDLDWEYPAARGGSPEDKKNFIELCRDLRAAFNKHNYLLTAAVGATKQHRDTSYDVPNMSKYLDFINVMSYDIHSYEEEKTGQNAPLMGNKFDQVPELNVNDIIEGWIREGAAPEKLILSVGFYGKSFTLQNPSANKLGARTVGGGTQGEHTKTSGILSYLEICSRLKNDGWTRVWDDEQKVPYAFKGNQWVGYDDPESLKQKARFAKQKKLGGVMMWSIEQDDVHNMCNEGSYPLLRTLNNELKGSENPEVTTPKSVTTTSKTKKKQNQKLTSPSQTTTPKSTTTTKRTTTIKSPTSSTGTPSPSKANAAGSSSCTGPTAPDPNDCSAFFLCDGQGNKFPMKCGAGTLFDKNVGVCNHAALVKC